MTRRNRSPLSLLAPGRRRVVVMIQPGTGAMRTSPPWGSGTDVLCGGGVGARQLDLPDDLDVLGLEAPAMPALGFFHARGVARGDDPLVDQQADPLAPPLDVV